MRYTRGYLESPADGPPGGLRFLSHHSVVSPANRRRHAAATAAAEDLDSDSDPVPAEVIATLAMISGEAKAANLMGSVEAALDAMLHPSLMSEQSDGTSLMARIATIERASGSNELWKMIASDDELARKMREALRTTVFRASRNYLLQDLDTFVALEETQVHLRELIDAVNTEVVGRNFARRQEEKHLAVRAMRWIEAKRAQKWSIVVFRTRAQAEAAIDPLQRCLHEAALCGDTGGGGGLRMLLFPRVDMRDPIVDVERVANAVRTLSERGFEDEGGDSHFVRNADMATCRAVAMLGLWHNNRTELTEHFNRWHREGGSALAGAALRSETDEEMAEDCVEYISLPINPHDSPRMRVHFSSRALFGALAPKWSHHFGRGSDGEDSEAALVAGEEEEEEEGSNDDDGDSAGSAINFKTIDRTAANWADADAARRGDGEGGTNSKFELYQYLETADGMETKMHVLAQTLEDDALDNFFIKILVATVMQLVQDDKVEAERKLENYELTFDGHVHTRRSFISAMASWPQRCCGKPSPCPNLNVLLLLRAVLYTSIAMQGLMPLIFASSIYVGATRKVAGISIVDLWWYWSVAVATFFSLHFIGHWVSKLVQGAMLIASNADLATVSAAVQNLLSCAAGIVGIFVAFSQYIPYYLTYIKFSVTASTTIMIMQLLTALSRKRTYDRKGFFQNISCLHEIITISSAQFLRSRSTESRNLLRKRFTTDDAGKGHRRLKEYRRFLKRREIVEYKRRGESATWHQLHSDLDEVNGDLIARQVFQQQKNKRPLINLGGTLNKLLKKNTVMPKAECEFCSQKFDVINRPAGCFKCGVQLCRKCLHQKRSVMDTGYHQPVSVCEFCAADVDEDQAMVDHEAYFRSRRVRRHNLTYTYGEAFVKQLGLVESETV